MQARLLLFEVLFVFSFASILNPQSKTLAERLGYPVDSKLLIIHADDLAVAHSVDLASFDALDKGAVTSASIMMPCPWSQKSPHMPMHLQKQIWGCISHLNSEWKTYRWGTVESKDKVASLLDSAATLWIETGQFAANAKPEEVEREIRAQVERAVAMGIHPTHLDTHMGSLLATPEIFAAYTKVAHEFHRSVSVREVSWRERENAG
jgi:chitin disaccharide deacetylase